MLDAFSPRQELFICPTAGGEGVSLTGMVQQPQYALTHQVCPH